MVEESLPDTTFTNATSLIVRRNKGGRPKKAASEKRTLKHEIYLSAKEEEQLKQMVATTGKSIADLFRYGLFEKSLKIARSQVASAELLAILSDFRKNSSLLQLLAYREREFNAQEKEILLGSSSSLWLTIERLQRHVFASLDKSNEFIMLTQLLEEVEAIRQELKGNEKPLLSDYQKLDKLVEKLERWLNQHYRYLTLL